MSSSDGVPTSFLCPITHEVMRDPVTTCDGQSYEHEAIRKWLEKHNLSPLTGNVLESKALVRNHALRNAIGEFERARPDIFPVDRDSFGACKVIILGDSGVGKTSLLARVENGGFSTSMPATVGCSFCPHTIQLSNGRSVELHLWDTAGQERYRAFTRQYFRGSVAAIVAYDLTNWGSFTGAKSWIADLQNELPDPKLVLALVGCKSDRCPGERQVATKEAKMLALEHGMSFFEVSSLDGTNVNALFRVVATRIDQTQNNPLTAKGITLEAHGLLRHRHGCMC